ncbi:probable long-chain-fatty-acid--CoA ligase [Thalassiosira pseudonana CCMP1335]|uniref:Probable long-chain-fatty-acid--CoA ligase n=1 Tax=Thalassiosira pseudonana TaxID=35128 RepID=B5YMH8_THAPS|nr:probable long-chain-fatty-acid--CoA ligase [Thalassiosira pseudonana CCMP1335]ACI64462.1 probable long-chain-fatty-acid--CoA ligase [Thalassiosira pseudonana CCMP1335]
MRDVISSCPEIWTYTDALIPEKTAIYDEHLCDNIVNMTYHQVNDAVHRSAAAFTALGIKEGDHVAVFGENSAHWLFVDHGIQRCGGATVVRGAESPIDELRYIYDNSDAHQVVVLQGPSLLKKLAEAARKDGSQGIGLKNKHVRSSEVHALCFANQQFFLRNVFFQLPKLKKDDLATIVYTSGTTGRPKGVMLTHGNLLHQIQLRFAPTKKYDVSEPLPGEVMVSILPVWHITERAAELCIFSRGCTLVYSNVKHLKNDLALHKPHWMMLVPRVLEKVALGVKDKFSKKNMIARAMIHFFTLVASTKSKLLKVARGQVIAAKKPNLFRRVFSRCLATLLTPLDAIGHALVWNKVKAALGGRQKLIVSGGSALNGSLEEFYETCGVLLIVGYGLTECSPLICHRRSDSNLVAGGCVGLPVTSTEIRVVDVNAKAGDAERTSIEKGQIGLVLAKGPQVMKGYYNNQKATNKSIDKYGWLDTGDLGYINPATNDLFITGRAKDTIVLSNGENVEPSPLEDVLLGCNMIDQVTITTSQDEKQLHAIAVLNPRVLAEKGFIDNETGEMFQPLVDQINDPRCSKANYEKAVEALSKYQEEIRGNKRLHSFLVDEAKRLLKKFRKWEQIGSFYVLIEPFAMVNDLLTQSYKVKRGMVIEKYSNNE